MSFENLPCLLGQFDAPNSLAPQLELTLSARWFFFFLSGNGIRDVNLVPEHIGCCQGEVTSKPLAIFCEQNSTVNEFMFVL